MKKKKRIDPLSEGSLKDISKLFQPLIKLCPPDWHPRKWMEYLFHVDERRIRRYICIAPFEMPGLFRPIPSQALTGFGYRYTRKGATAYVRMDDTMPERIDVEVNNGQGKNWQLFSLTSYEWRKIKRYFLATPSQLRSRN